MLLRSSLITLAVLALLPGVASAAKSYDSCTGFIDSLPASITSQGTWCLRADLATSISIGTAIQVPFNNVTIDCNGFMLSNLAAGKGTKTNGIVSTGTTNVTVRNCSVRGFATGIRLSGQDGRFLAEDNRVQGATSQGIYVDGDGSAVRGNIVRQIGGSTTIYDKPIGISASGAADVIDNSISGIAGTQGATAIFYGFGERATITGNRIRELGPSGSTMKVGVSIQNGSNLLVRGNDLSTAGGTIGIACNAASNRVRDNVVNGFATAINDWCGDAGGNDVTAP